MIYIFLDAKYDLANMLILCACIHSSEPKQPFNWTKLDKGTDEGSFDSSWSPGNNSNKVKHVYVYCSVCVRACVWLSAVCACKSSSIHFCVYSVDWIEFQGSKYCLGDVIWCGHEEELPKFGKLIKILLVMSQVFLL